jgi:hypothetical protein
MLPIRNKISANLVPIAPTASSSESEANVASSTTSEHVAVANPDIAHKQPESSIIVSEDKLSQSAEEHASAANQVFGAPELLELILCQSVRLPQRY